MESAASFKIRLGTRTYFYNLAQANAKNLLLIDFTGKLDLKDVGIKVVHPGASYFAALGMPADPFDRSQAAAFLAAPASDDLQALAASLTDKAQSSAFASRRRLFTFVCATEHFSAETLLAEMFVLLQQTPTLRSLRNSFDLEADDVRAHYDALVAAVLRSLELKGVTGEHAKQEMRLFLAGVRLFRQCALENAETLLLKSGQRDLLLKYPFFDKAATPNLLFDLQREQALPSEILVEHVFLGNGKHVG